MNRSLVVFVSLVGAALASPLRLEAATHTWKGGTGVNFSTAANWVEGTAPAAGEGNLVLAFPPMPPSFALTNDVVGLTVQTLSFTEGAYNLSGLPITLTSAVSFPSSLANTFVQVGIGLALTGPVTVTIGNNLGLSFDGTVSGAGGLVKAGAGTLQIFGANTYQGATSIQEGGVFLFDTATGLGSAGAGTSVATNALLYVSGMVTVAEPLTLAAGATLGCGSGSPVWSGPVTLSGPGQSGINTNTGATLTVSGLISGAGGLGHGGGGPLVLTNDNTYADATVTGYGNALLVVNGSQPQSDVTVANGGSLGGSGVVGVVATNGGGTITPGFGPGVLSTKNLFLILIDTVRIDLNGTSPGTGYDRISAAGNVFLGGSTLQVVLGFTPAPGSVFTIVQATGTVNETFAGLAQDATFQVSGKSFQIHYGANAVTLTAVCAMADSTAPTVSAPPAATITQSRCN